MRTTRKSSPIILLSLSALALVLCASPSVRAADGSFEGIVVEDGVKVRAGAGRTFYIIGSLKKGAKVQVDEVIFGWNKIAAPDTVFSYISKAFVDSQGDGSVGTVSRNDAPVNAASLKGPGESYRHQLDLEKGDSVKIVGEEGSFYKVIPPSLSGKKQAYVYLPPGSVQKAQIAEPEPVKPPVADTPPTPPTPPTPTPPVPPTPPINDDTTKPDATKTDVVNKDDPGIKITVPDIKKDLPDAKPDIPEVTPPVVPPVTTPAAPKNDIATPEVINKDDGPAVIEPKVIVPSPAALQTFKFENKDLQTIEAKMAKALLLPLDKQPIAELMIAYHAYLGDASLSAQDEYFLNARIIQLKRNSELAKSLIALKQAKQSVTDDPIITPAAELNAAHIAAAPHYDATGRLQTSGVYDGVNLPRLLRLVDPTTKRTVAYIRPSDQVNAERSLGQLIGIKGKTRLDRGLNLRIIDVTDIDILEAVNADAAKSSAALDSKE